MSKFKVGDKVVRTHPSSKLVVGETYIIKEILSIVPVIILEGYSNMYNLDNFELAEIDDRVVDTSEILTPSQAAEAILNEDKLQVYDTDCNKWYTFSCGHRNITIEDLKHIKLRLKPKTILINGVEVPAPAKKDDIEHYFYTVNFSEGIIHTIDKLYINNNFKHYWATEKDAQKVLDALLIPLNGL